MYKVVFLDWFKTLSDSLFWEKWANNSKYSKDLLKIQAYMFSNGNTIVKDWMRGQLDAETAVRKISRNTLVPYQTIMDELIASAEAMNFKDTHVVDNIKILRESGLKVVIATDNMDTFIRWTVPAMGLEPMFDGIIDSYSKKALKTDFSGGDNLFFKEYLEKTNLKPGESILIDDSKEAITVENIGIKFMHFDGSRSLSGLLRDLKP